MIAGWAFGSLVMSPYADTHGRRGPFLACVLAEIFIWPFLLTKVSLDTLYVLCFLFGMCITGRMTIGYVLLTETMPKSHRVNVSLFFYFTDAAVTFWLTLYFWFLSQNWLYINYF